MHDFADAHKYVLPTDTQVAKASDAFKLLSDPTRIKLIWVLLHGEHSVQDLAKEIGATLTSASQHLSKLRLAKLVSARRAGTHMYYSAADPHVARLLTEALFHADHQLDPLSVHETE